MAEEGPSQPTVYSYDTDCGRKMSLAKSVDRSSYRYAIMRSHSPRFMDPSGNRTPFGVYNMDLGRKKTLESCCRDNRRFYASSFQSNVPRFTRPWTSPTVDVFYDPTRMKNAQPSSLSKSLDVTPIEYAIHRSKYKRFPDKPVLSEGPDVVYDIDRGNKMSLTTSVAKSPISYAIVGAPTKKFQDSKVDSYQAQLGPGFYDAPYHKDVRASHILENRPLSSLASSSPRFSGRADPYKNLGSTWRQEKDTKNWNQHGVTISKADYLRPQYLPNSYKQKAADKDGRK